jgi:hypothetical protein
MHTYEVRPMTIINPDGCVDGWAIFHMVTDEWVVRKDPPTEEPNFPWFAKTRRCALAYVRYLNGLDDVEPPCMCEYISMN